VALSEQARVAGTPFDLAILDLTISGGMGGLATAARLRRIDPKILTIAARPARPTGVSGRRGLASCPVRKRGRAQASVQADADA
jgi:CheY-like chemotaxis protein